MYHRTGHSTHNSPLPALVRSDSPQELLVFQPENILLDGTSGNAEFLHHFGKRHFRVPAQHFKQSLGGFLTTFSYHLFLTTLRLASRLQRPKDHVEHEIDEDAGIARLLGRMKRLVVSTLVA